MSDFNSSDHLPVLWADILRQHWTFLETEEGKQKIEERTKLEGCLKEFLCVVPHDRKFFLPETAHVLKQSVREMEDFTPQKGMIGFETLSQYANNLFTKPWRKEFRVLKMYSGSFQHDIHSNLIHAVKLFEAMGYRHLSDQSLILDGPICPDQVTNVSRDAMAAYVECKIMNQISSGLSAMGLKCTLIDIFNYREKHTGGITQTIQGLASAIQDRRHRKEKLLSDNSYVTIQHAPGAVPVPPPRVSQCPNCVPYYHNLTPSNNLMHTQQQQQQQCSFHSNQLQSSACTLYPTTGKVNAICNSSNNTKLFTPYSAPHMSHSRSLEHYNEPPPLLPHRHSFDHQQQGCTAHQGHYQVPRSHAQFAQHLYESPYDCIDGGDDSLDGSSASYAAVALPNNSQVTGTYAQPYNVSGNRYPLPYNISNQLNTHYSNPSVVTCNGVKGMDPYGTAAVENMYATVSKPAQNWNHHNVQSHQVLPSRLHGTNSTKDYYMYGQRMFSPEQLIDFDDQAPLTSHDYHAQQHIQGNKQYNGIYGDHGQRIDREYKQQQSQRLGNTNGSNPTYAEPKDILCQQHALACNTTSSDDLYSNNLYARPVPRGNRLKDGSSILEPQTKHMTDKYIRKAESVQGYDDNNHKMQMELINRYGDKFNGGPRRKLSSHRNECNSSDLSYDLASFDDFVNVGHSEHPQRSPTQASKNQDGVGSFESWDYVFQNLERSGYSKDLGERGDLLVQSLDLDSLNLTGAAGNAGTGNIGNGVGNDNNGGGVSNVGMVNQSQSAEKLRSINHAIDIKPTNTNKQIIVEKSRTLDKNLSTETKRETKTNKQEKPSILKQTSIVTGNGVKKSKPALKPTISNNLNIDHSKSNGSATNERNITRQISNSTNNSNGVNVNSIVAGNKSKTMTVRPKQQTPIATQVIVSSPNEWNCRFCTFLNPNTKRICEMCSHSKDFNPEETIPNTPTCV